MQLNEEVALKEQGQTRIMCFHIFGECMYPTLRLGDRVITMDSGKYRLGDIVALRGGKDYLMHRIVAKLNGQFLLKGDRGGPQGHFCSAQALLGRAVFRERNCEIKPIDTFWSRISGLVISLGFIIIRSLALAPAGFRRKRQA